MKTPGRKTMRGKAVIGGIGIVVLIAVAAWSVRYWTVGRFLESTNNAYLRAGKLHLERLGRGYAWLDTGTHESLLEAAMFIQAIEKRQGLKVCCPEEIAYRVGFIDAAQMRKHAAALAKSGYGSYLLEVLQEGVRDGI